jgi:hypothetical protein
MAVMLRKKERGNFLSMRGLGRPGKFAGIAGMVLVAGLYMAHALLLRLSGQGLGLPWLVLLVLPGALAALLSHRAGGEYSPEHEGALAGLLTAHFAAVLQVVVLMISVFNIDWAAYNAQVGSDIGSGVRAMAIPASAVASIVLIAVTYTGCIFASWLGALAYARITNYEL